ncbi:YhjD/YihY/BrkB family envelope integrity protein [Pseudonocardia benzenivorans]|uniref:Ribonuclease BN n=2 Tax=Pseudonocardia TaxID=1847 RepID=F4CTD0_PSEUX|nr:YhjD/YihY/BrkB family envelope integrity protein [Pseudonocardia dioxanivorans]AEA27355.1 ribonuclease BN [Pseudonocardia dioxanivorans CB1190]GJF07017.1 hypothetical protein PSD17_59640 [Pseudonocardia sp. D17]
MAGRSSWRLRVDAWAAWGAASFPGRVLARFTAIDGYDRALALAAQAFVTLVPMLMVVVATVPPARRASLGDQLVANLGLSGDAAAVVLGLLRTGGEVTAPATAAGAVVLVVSLVGFTRTMQRAFVAAWGLPAPGLAGLWPGLLGATALLAEVVAVVVLSPLLGVFTGSALIAAVAHAVGAALLWWPVQYLMLGRRIGPRALLPGTIVTGLGQLAVITVSDIYLPPVAAHQADRYGLIGIAFVLLSWLVVLGVLLVSAAVVGAELAARADRPGAPRGPAHTDDRGTTSTDPL